MSADPTPGASGSTAATGPVAPPRTPAASIHNIGYRKYDGERLGRGYAMRSLFVQSLRGAYGLGRSAKSKVLPMVLFGVVLAPSLIMVAIAVATDAKELPAEYTAYPLIMLPLIGLYVAAMAPQSVSRDLRFRTTPLYFSRPIERTDYVIAKYSAMSVALLIFVGTPMLVMYVGGLLAKLGFVDQTKGFALGLVMALVFSVLHAGIGLLVAAVTPRRGFGVAAIIGVLTIPYFATTIMQFIVYDEGSREAVSWLGLASPGTLMDGFQSKFLDGSTDFPGSIVPSNTAGICYLLVIAAVIAGSYLLLNARYRKAGL
ncbi:ABC transporter permease [Streptomyces sp. P38-E01]|uniref:ABC transporter permease n=1 Tax=Streptomyces tardus TaxID=2780544 RepID=A0A949JFU3_9ACTN|nr:ABC transporter permease subunit [Streptomyces tardus]MBU7597734.1 ABC transporter permease [Streptomyces tardus]